MKYHLIICTIFVLFNAIEVTSLKLLSKTRAAPLTLLGSPTTTTTKKPLKSTTDSLSSSLLGLLGLSSSKPQIKNSSDDDDDDDERIKTMKKKIVTPTVTPIPETEELKSILQELKYVQDKLNVKPTHDLDIRKIVPFASDVTPVAPSATTRSPLPATSNLKKSTEKNVKLQSENKIEVISELSDNKSSNSTVDVKNKIVPWVGGVELRDKQKSEGVVQDAKIEKEGLEEEEKESRVAQIKSDDSTIPSLNLKILNSFVGNSTISTESEGELKKQIAESSSPSFKDVNPEGQSVQESRQELKTPLSDYETNVNSRNSSILVDIAPELNVVDPSKPVVSSGLNNIPSSSSVTEVTNDQKQAKQDQHESQINDDRSFAPSPQEKDPNISLKKEEQPKKLTEEVNTATGSADLSNLECDVQIAKSKNRFEEELKSVEKSVQNISPVSDVVVRSRKDDQPIDPLVKYLKNVAESKLLSENDMSIVTDKKSSDLGTLLPATLPEIKSETVDQQETQVNEVASSVLSVPETEANVSTNAEVQMINPSKIEESILDSPVLSNLVPSVAITETSSLVAEEKNGSQAVQNTTQIVDEQRQQSEVLSEKSVKVSKYATTPDLYADPSIPPLPNLEFKDPSNLIPESQEQINLSKKFHLQDVELNKATRELEQSINASTLETLSPVRDSLSSVREPQPDPFVIKPMESVSSNDKHIIPEMSSTHEADLNSVKDVGKLVPHLTLTVPEQLSIPDRQTQILEENSLSKEVFGDLLSSLSFAQPLPPSPTPVTPGFNEIISPTLSEVSSSVLSVLANAIPFIPGLGDVMVYTLAILNGLLVTVSSVIGKSLENLISSSPPLHGILESLLNLPGISLEVRYNIAASTVESYKQLSKLNLIETDGLTELLKLVSDFIVALSRAIPNIIEGAPLVNILSTLPNLTGTFERILPNLRVGSLGFRYQTISDDAGLLDFVVSKLNKFNYRDTPLIDIHGAEINLVFIH